MVFAAGSPFQYDDIQYNEYSDEYEITVGENPFIHISDDIYRINGVLHRKVLVREEVRYDENGGVSIDELYEYIPLIAPRTPSTANGNVNLSDHKTYRPDGLSGNREVKVVANASFAWDRNANTVRITGSSYTVQGNYSMHIASSTFTYVRDDKAEQIESAASLWGLIAPSVAYRVSWIHGPLGHSDSITLRVNSNGSY